MTGRRSKTRKTVRGSSFEKDIMKEEDSVEDHEESSSSRETLTKFTQSIRQNSSSAEPSSHPAATNETENGVESWKGKADLWKPLNYLVEVANRSKSSKFSSQGSAVKSEPHARKNKVKEHGQKFRVQDEKNSINPGPSGSVKPRKLRRQMKAEAFGESTVSPQAVVEAGVERKMNPVWFSLVASNNQGGCAPLPQISASYLRIKDGNVPVSFIQKYLRRKLDLASEDEIEIKCMGQSVFPSWRLNNLVELWLQTASTSQRVPARIGSSAKEFVLVLAYARKVRVH
ncbi:hypothetical protein RJ639_031490 [Escallonia herrerae]|uniref:E3 ubiquitin protein ligase DRIP2-like n=1 Tax=Escallonia herrerae TaxID=1293975 RepID=A0AA89BHP4_9ASTE|nr:hypothetical protein RJ639_031490 [Escallonia herrerae]